jgi:hypothetical protein
MGIKLDVTPQGVSVPGGAMSSSLAIESQSQPGTLIMATPSKPRHANAIFASRISSSHFSYPTPIREESSSEKAVRPAYVAETPVGPGRMSAMPFPLDKDRIMETPRAPRFGEIVEEVDEEDDLGGLMVMTDEEDEGYADGNDTWGGVPETPAR